MKVILIVLAAVAVIVIVLGMIAKQKSEKYYKYSNPVGEMEKQYTPMGSCKVAKLEIASEDPQIGRFVIYYPEGNEDSEEKYPVILWANGTGFKSETYTPFLKHLSSWGFIVVSNNDENTRTFKDGWKYDISKVHVPTLLTAGTGSFDAGTAESPDQKSDEKAGIMQGICPLWSLQENFNLLPDDIDKAYFRKKNVDHGDSYLQFDAYMTAWFRWQLQGDEEAAKVFTGESPEIMTNDLYQDQMIHIAK